jgi:phosphoenolpyruvate carboxylase
VIDHVDIKYLSSAAPNVGEVVGVAPSTVIVAKSVDTFVTEPFVVSKVSQTLKNQTQDHVKVIPLPETVQDLAIASLGE